MNSLRATTDVVYELIVVDNGSTDGSADYALEAADVAVTVDENLGFAKGMNRGLAVARGQFVTFANNDTVFPNGWAPPLLSHFIQHNRVGIVIPAVTAAGNPVTVRSTPGDDVITLSPFGDLPSGVVYVMQTEMIRSLGGWNEVYPIATGEDLDLLFTIWTNDLDVILDTRVLIHHESQGTLAGRRDRQELRRDNLELFLTRWQSEDEVVVDPSVAPDIYLRNRSFARAAAKWIARLVEAREEAAELRRAMAKRNSVESDAFASARDRSTKARFWRRNQR